MRVTSILLSTAVLPCIAIGAEWLPEWKSMSLPGIATKTTVAPHHSKQPNGHLLYWVYLTYPHPQPAPNHPERIFAAELQEWVVNCKKLEGYVPTIRYSIHTEPGEYDDFMLTHPNGRVQLSSQQIGAVCEFNT
jgi:hypothetical protein